MEEVQRKVSFDEFKLYYESTEKVTDRRLDANRWNYSICVAILVAVAAIIKWGVTSTDLRSVGIAAVLVLCVMAALFCQLWVAQVRDFKRLNDAKFDVLNEMSPLIEFDLSHPGVITSYRPFEREWVSLKGSGAVDRVRRIDVIALRSSHMEYFIPRAFQIVFIGVMVALILALSLTPLFPTKPPSGSGQHRKAR